MTSSLIARPCSEAQVTFIKDLLDRVGCYDADQAVALRNQFNAEWRTSGRLSMEVASKRIGELLDMVKALGASAPQATAVSSDVPSGRYAVATDAGPLAFYRVWVGDRATLAYLIVSDSEQRLSRATTKGVLAKISEVGVVESSKMYGREIGCCGVCGRTLTNEDSRAAGIGPICAKRF